MKLLGGRVDTHGKSKTAGQTCLEEFDFLQTKEAGMFHIHSLSSVQLRFAIKGPFLANSWIHHCYIDANMNNKGEDHERTSRTVFGEMPNPSERNLAKASGYTLQGSQYTKSTDNFQSTVTVSFNAVKHTGDIRG